VTTGINRSGVLIRHWLVGTRHCRAPHPVAIPTASEPPNAFAAIGLSSANEKRA
jgi:hypothetical protein